MEDFIKMMLEQETLEDLLERFDITPEEAFWKLYDAGLIDPNLVEELYGGSSENFG